MGRIANTLGYQFGSQRFCYLLVFFYRRLRTDLTQP